MAQKPAGAAEEGVIFVGVAPGPSGRAERLAVVSLEDDEGDRPVPLEAPGAGAAGPGEDGRGAGEDLVEP